MYFFSVNFYIGFKHEKNRAFVRIYLSKIKCLIIK